jgi:hypothetical protein
MKSIPSLSAALLYSILPAGAYELHEWGTFTTVSGSDGVLLAGLQREEEPLPPFVHSHFGLENGQLQNPDEIQRLYKLHGTAGFTLRNSKGLADRPVASVTVKMETPVLYFHSDAAFHAHVSVGFTGGTISQWYPDRSGGETLPEPAPPADPLKNPTPIEKWTLDFSKPYQGAIEWDVDVLSPADSRAALTFKPGDSVNWLRARGPESNVLRTASGETENYLFYRGIGHFTPGLRTSVSADETLQLENQTGGNIPYLLVFERDSGIVRWHANADGIPSGGTLKVPESILTAASGAFPAPIYASMKTGLAAAGLLPAEADAMIQTWWTSYFERDGLRVFWVLPTSATDRILPLNVTPAPEKTVRVLVGRSEVLRPRREAGWLAASRLTGDNAWQWTSLINTDRFGLAIQERIKAIESGKSATAGK